MGMLYLVLALLFGLVTAVVAMANSEIVTVNYLIGHVRLFLIAIILEYCLCRRLDRGLFYPLSQYPDSSKISGNTP